MKQISMVPKKAVPVCSTVCRTGLRHFDLAKIFDCGQSFRFNRVENSCHEKEYSGVAYGKWISFAQDGDCLTVYHTDEREFEGLWQGYLGLDMDYEAIAENILDHVPSDAMRCAIAYGDGIRILRQEPFEMMISFIVSQNNNIPRIKKIIETISKNCGNPILREPSMEPHLSQASSLYTFPDAASLASLGIDGLYAMKTGFRARYLYDAAVKTLSSEVVPEQAVQIDDTEEAIRELCRIHGIGRKVASCILLFTGHHFDAFPVDVWMQRSLARLFPDVSENRLSPTEFFGPYAGIAQQYLFYAERNFTVADMHD